MMRACRHLAIAMILAICATGCFPDPVQDVRSHAFVADKSLESAYAELLDNVSWQKVKIDKATFVEVRGIVKGTGDQLVVRYESKPRPPVVSAYEYNGASGSPAAFATLLHELHLRRQILATPAAEATQ